METVIYQGKFYNVIHKYKSGYCEIRPVEDENFNSIILVNTSEIETVETKKE